MSAVANRDQSLLVTELFGPTVQGEGPSCGQRAMFVRLSRCNLTCPSCDTPYTWDTRRYDLRAQSRRMLGSDVATWVLTHDTSLVVVTGGEPLLQQQALEPVVEALVARGRRVEVETNGTCVPTARMLELASFNVSPKLGEFGAGMSYDQRIRPEALAVLAQSGKARFKFVLCGPEELHEVADLAAEHGLAPIWVMPEGTDAATVTARLARIAPPAIDHGFHVSTRLHVLIWGNERGR